jgi:hypothetical protein
MASGPIVFLLKRPHEPNLENVQNPAVGDGTFVRSLLDDRDGSFVVTKSKRVFTRATLLFCFYSSKINLELRTSFRTETPKGFKPNSNGSKLEYQLWTSFRIETSKWSKPNQTNPILSTDFGLRSELKLRKRFKPNQTNPILSTNRDSK